MPEPAVYWNEGPDFNKRETPPFDRAKPPLAEMPCVFGPENSPPTAPREPVDAVLAQSGKSDA